MTPRSNFDLRPLGNSQQTKPRPWFSLSFLILFPLILLMGLWGTTSAPVQAEPAPLTTASNPKPFPLATPIAIATHPLEIHKSPQSQAGVVSLYNQGIFGPQICTAYGDPFSPLGSAWHDGLYTYEYRIRIPADYEERTGSSLVRVEILDPDSINNAPSSIVITHSDRWLNAGPARPPTRIINNPCSRDNRNGCSIPTGEMVINCSDDQRADPNIFCEEDAALINPTWLVRLDENRGSGSGNGNGQCGMPASYTPRYNTQTLYELYYVAQAVADEPVWVPLAAYTGQVGDGVRDHGDHNSDLQWTTPGAVNDFGVVPTDCNSSTGGYLRDPDDTRCPLLPSHTITEAVAGPHNGFEIDLATHTPHMVPDEVTGDRYLYLDVTTISGASENSFELWAGPPAMSLGVPSDVNARNLYIVNNPGARHSGGVGVFALGALPINALLNGTIQMPLLDVPAEYAGQTIPLSLFDTDAGTQPPIRFYFDTIARDDYEIIYGLPGDPRCFSPGGNCDNRWVGDPWQANPVPDGGPPFYITIPQHDPVLCDETGLPEVCTPFYGGRLYAEYRHGVYDTSVWWADFAPDPTPPPTNGCQAFPIIVEESTRSLGEEGNPFPTFTTQTYPLAGPDAPTLADFPQHRIGFGLREAQPGYAYVLQLGPGSGGFQWAIWNRYISRNTSVLADNLTWPGRSGDYHTVASGQTPPFYFDHPVYGFIAADDPTDIEMHIGDNLMIQTGVNSSSAVREALNAHVDYQHILRLPISLHGLGGGAGSDVWVEMTGFALFRLHGYLLGVNNTWLLLEFMGWDESCGQLAPVAVGLEPSQAQTVTVGQTAVYTHTLTNLGTGVDQFTLTAVSTLDWPLTIVPTMTTELTAGASLPVTVTVQVPSDVLSGTIDTTVLTAVSQVDTAVQATVTNTTTSLAVMPPAYSCATQNAIPETECEALVAIYEANPDANLSGWVVEGSSPCSWSGVVCAAGVITQINLPGRTLTTLPAEIGLLSNLERLSLWGNRLTVVPAEIGQLGNLKRLSLSGTQLTDLPAEIGQLSNLQELDLSANQLMVVPAEMGQLSNLQNLSLRSNQLTALPGEIGQLSNLQELYLHGNQLTALPPEIGQLSNLQELDLFYNQLMVMPAEIGQLINLQNLHLRGNQLTAVPAEIGELSNLQWLDLSDNQLTALPVEIGQLSNLQLLDLFDNQLTALPVEIGLLGNLQWLRLEKNQLTAVPAAIGQLDELLHLFLAENQLTAVPAEIGLLNNLQELGLSDNQLTALPSEIGQLSNLRALLLDSNKLCLLPVTVTNLTSMGSLLVSHNHLAPTDPDLIAWLNTYQPNWADTQTPCPAFGVALDAPTSALTTTVGNTVSYTVSINNTGNVSDTFALTTTNHAWPTTFPDSVTLVAGETTTVTVQVQVPLTATHASQDSALLTALSQSVVTSTASITLTTTALNPHYGVSLVAPISVLTNTVGSMVTYTVHLTNEGNMADTFVLTATNQAWLTTMPDSVSLAAGATDSFAVQVQVPLTATHGAQDSVLVTATSGMAPEVSANVLLTTTAFAPMPQLVLDAPTTALTTTIGHTVTYTIYLTNTGNVHDTFALTTTNHNHAWPTTLPDSISLAAGEMMTFTVQVAVPLTATQGAQDTVLVTATSGMAGDVMASVSLTTTAVLPPLPTPNNTIFLPLMLRP